MNMYQNKFIQYLIQNVNFTISPPKNYFYSFFHIIYMSDLKLLYTNMIDAKFVAYST